MADLGGRVSAKILVVKAGATIEVGLLWVGSKRKALIDEICAPPIRLFKVTEALLELV